MLVIIELLVHTKIPLFIIDIFVENLSVHSLCAILNEWERCFDCILDFLSMKNHMKIKLWKKNSYNHTTCCWFYLYSTLWIFVLKLFRESDFQIEGSAQNYDSLVPGLETLLLLKSLGVYRKQLNVYSRKHIKMSFS